MKKRIGLFATVAVTSLFAFCVFKGANTVSCLYAEETSSQPTEVIEEPEQQEEEENKFVDKISNFKDTFLVPLLGGVSLASVGSAFVAIAVALINRKSFKLLRDQSSLAGLRAAAAAEAAEKATDRSEKLAENLTALANVALAESKKIVERAEKLVESSKEETETVKQGLIKMKECMLLLVKVQAEIIKSTPKAISDGVAKNVAELEQKAEQIME